MQGSEWSRNYPRLRSFCAVFISATLLLCAMNLSFGSEWQWLSASLAASFSGNSAADDRSLTDGLADLSHEPHLGARLSIQNIEQMPELPNGCEATSLTIILNYLGMKADKEEIADDYLPKYEFVKTRLGFVSGDPELIYPGNPRPGGSGYYCYPAVVAETGNRYFAQNDAPYAAFDVTGADEDQLLTYLDNGIPVIVWNTLDNTEPLRSDKMEWILANSEETYIPFVNLHVSVLAGYDDNWFYFCDPLGQNEKLKRGEFMDIYEEMGSRAMVVHSFEDLEPEEIHAQITWRINWRTEEKKSRFQPVDLPKYVPPPPVVAPPSWQGSGWSGQGWNGASGGNSGRGW